VTKRLQVLLDDAELRSIQRIARRERLTTAEWVRRQLREGAQAAGPNTASKLAAIHRAVHLQDRAPSPTIDQMLEEIERGYRYDPS
jgi:hypothetical protein